MALKPRPRPRPMWLELCRRTGVSHEECVRVCLLHDRSGFVAETDKHIIETRAQIYAEMNEEYHG